MSTQTNSEKKLKNCLQNKSSPRLVRGFSLLSAYENFLHAIGWKEKRGISFLFFSFSLDEKGFLVYNVYKFEVYF